MGGGWVTAINVDLSQWVCVRTDTHKEKACRVEEKQRSQKRGRKEEGKKKPKGDLFVDYCVTREAPHNLLEEIWT